MLRRPEPHPAHHAPETRTPDHRFISLIAGATALALIVLFLRHRYPPLFDWPSHMARHYLESLALAGRPLPEFYALDFAIMPNLGGDMVVPGLILLLGSGLASKVFLIVSVGLVWSGASAFIVQYAGRTTAAFAAALIVAPWLLSASLFLGFLNSYSGAGVGLWVAVIFIHVARTGITIARLALVAGLVALTYLWHLSAFGIFAVVAASYVCDRLMHGSRSEAHDTLKELLPLYLTTIPTIAMALWVTWAPGVHTLSGAVEWHFGEKLKNFLELFQAYTTWLDAVLVLVWLTIVACLFAPPARDRLRLDYVGIAALAFVTLAFALPTNVGLTYFIDKRPILPFFVCCCALLATLAPGRYHRIALTALAALIAVRIGTIDTIWTARSRGAQDLVRYFETQPRGARILVANTFFGWRRSYEVHAPAWLVISAGAYVSNVWAIPGQQPLRHTTPSHGLVPSHFLSEPAVLVTHAATISKHFDYVWVNDPTRIVAIPPGWTRMLTTDESSLWRVR